MIASVRPTLLSLKRRTQAFVTGAYFGRAAECPCCGGRYDHFLPYGVKPRPHSRCPGCGAVERHRLLALYLESKRDVLFGARPFRILHAAPEPIVAALIRRYAGQNLEYVGGDLSPRQRPGAVRIDLTAIDQPSASFDAIICYHVLEHIKDDRLAMSEMLRVLKPGGWAILDVPIDWTLAQTFEADAGNDDERRRLFGDHRHVRCYASDFADRLRSVGWQVETDWFVRGLSGDDRVRYGLLDYPVHFCRR
jgi:SAM-dependent methyltransferase